MPTFSADDARLAGMHGYEPAKEPLEGRLRTAEQQNKAMGVGAYKSPAGDYPPPAETSVRKSDVVTLREHLERIEAKVDRIILAMKAQGLGMWGTG